jgi:hypothetical protein
MSIFPYVFFVYKIKSSLDFSSKILIFIVLFTFDITSMARTNKRGIAAKKAQQKKQASRIKGSRKFEYPKRKLDLEEGKELGIITQMTNPAGNTYHWFHGGRKICWETRLRVDPDGYRYIRTPSGGSEMVEIPMSGWVLKQMSKRR